MDTFETSANGNCKDLPPEIITLFRGFKPYKGGNDLLWALNQIVRANKHAVLAVFSIDVQRSEHVRIRHRASTEVRILFPPAQWDRSNQEFVVAVTK